MLHLHKKLNPDFLQFQMLSYSKFCLLKLFWVVQHNSKEKYTYFWEMYANSQLLVTKVNSVIAIIDAKVPEEVIYLH